MENIEAALANQPVLKGLTPQQLEYIAECAHEVRFDAGQTIFREGEVANYFYIITRGKVALEVFAPGRGPLTIDTVSEGDVVGWSWLFPPYRWHFDARALDLTRAIAFNAMCLRGKCDQDHDLGYELVKTFSHIIMERLQATRLRLLDLYGSETTLVK